jgi:uncharacterized protein (DUF342 family)
MVEFQQAESVALKDLESLAIVESSAWTVTFAMSADSMACYGFLQRKRSVVSRVSGAPEVSNANAGLSSEAVVLPLDNPRPIDLILCLHNYKISKSIDYAGIYELCAAIDTGLESAPQIVARGLEPVNGADGYFELCVRTFGEEAHFEEDERGNIDLKDLNAYSEIEPGNKLGTVYPPDEGVAGRDIFGRLVPAARGEEYLLSAGEGVQLKYEGRMAFATRAGRALVDKQTISVIDYLLVPGNLDMTIGNIDFHGFVEIRGDVPDDFSVSASKGLKIHGHVGGCPIESGGSIEMLAMAGKNVGRIICFGDLHVKFLNQVKVDCFASVHVAQEIRHSVVRAKGQIIVGGGVIGGTSIALEGIEAKSFGAASGLRTVVTSGVYFPDMERFDYLQARLEDFIRHIRLLEISIPPLETYLKTHPHTASAAKIRSRVLHEQLDLLYREKERCEAELDASAPQQFSSCNPKVNALQAIQEGVVVTLGQTSELLRQSLRGPMTLIENTQQGNLLQMTYSKLPVLASQLQRELFSTKTGGEESEAWMVKK